MTGFSSLFNVRVMLHTNSALNNSCVILRARRSVSYAGNGMIGRSKIINAHSWGAHDDTTFIAVASSSKGPMPLLFLVVGAFRWWSACILRQSVLAQTARHKKENGNLEGLPWIDLIHESHRRLDNFRSSNNRYPPRPPCGSASPSQCHSPPAVLPQFEQIVTQDYALQSRSNPVWCEPVTFLKIIGDHSRESW